MTQNRPDELALRQSLARLGVLGRPHRGPLFFAITTVVALLAILIVGSILKSLVLDYLWFKSVGYSSVYTTTISTRIWLFFVGAGLSAVVLGANVLVARRLAPSADQEEFDVSPELAQFYEELNRPLLRRGLLIAGIVVLGLAVLSFATSAAGHWHEILLFTHAQSFGREDPQFHRDVSFYVFKLPVYRFFVDWLLSLGVVSLIGAGLVYLLRALLYGFRLDGPRPILRHLFEVDAPWRIKLHVSVMVVYLLTLLVVRYWLSRFDLVYSTQGADIGAFYTDLHATLPLLYVQMVVSVVAVALVVTALFRGGLGLPVAAFALYFLVVVGSGIYPAIIQRFVVQPNELAREEPYLARNIAETRWAYGLDTVHEQPFPAVAQASAADVAADQETIDNVRLWDPDPLRSALNQLQTIRPLFEFKDVDVDRYVIDGKYRQVMLSARELNPARLPAEAKTWVNRTLQFTHGYGYAAAAVNQAQPDGSPSFLVRDIPLQGPLVTSHPEIYFGEGLGDFIVVDGNQPEFTPVAGDANVETRFQGAGGVAIGSLWRRLLVAWEFEDPNLLISGAIGSESRIIYRRNIQERIGVVAPFLQLDNDPYMVVDKDNIYWVQDAYTVTDRIPYSHRDKGLNYIRNSVKVSINAYSGEMKFYAMQPDEPILKAYASIYPKLFTPMSAMPQTLRDHIRYPEDLFSLQTDAYLRYHMTDPKQFYQKEDLWEVPTEFFGGIDQRLRPYYVLARLPDQPKLEFMLILSFVPRNRTNAIGWIAARSDAANYGQIVGYRYPTSESIPGPTQVERRIDSDARVSQQLTLWNQSGSKVIRGDLLMIPVGGSNMFFEALYLAATNGTNEIPQLKRVVIVNGETVVMEPTLARALDVLFGRATASGLDTAGAPLSPVGSATPTTTTVATPTRTPASVATPGTVTQDIVTLIAQAQQSYDRAQSLLRAGDFAGYGQEIERLKQILDRLQQQAGKPQ